MFFHQHLLVAIWGDTKLRGCRAGSLAKNELGIERVCHQLWSLAAIKTGKPQFQQEATAKNCGLSLGNGDDWLDVSFPQELPAKPASTKTLCGTQKTWKKLWQALMQDDIQGPRPSLVTCLFLLQSQEIFRSEANSEMPGFLLWHPAGWASQLWGGTGGEWRGQTGCSYLLPQILLPNGSTPG